MYKTMAVITGAFILGRLGASNPYGLSYTFFFFIKFTELTLQDNNNTKKCINILLYIITNQINLVLLATARYGAIHASIIKLQKQTKICGEHDRNMQRQVMIIKNNWE